MPIESSLSCPWCSAPMRSGPPPKSAVATCYECWGLWIDTKALREASGGHSARGRLGQAADALDAEQAETAGILCPACPDTRLLVQKIRGVEIDWCPGCRGIFLDKGEREQLVGAEAKPAPRPGPSDLRTKAGSSTGPAATALLLGGDLVDLIVDFVSDL